MQRILIIIDMQNDFVNGPLGSAEAEAIVPAVQDKLRAARQAGDRVIFTRDTHQSFYMDTLEGKKLPVPHCIEGTQGWQIIDALAAEDDDLVVDKPSFGSLKLAELLYSMVGKNTEIELCGLCTDICVVSNALILRANFPETPIVVDAKACAGVRPESHVAALTTMRMCHIDVEE